MIEKNICSFPEIYLKFQWLIDHNQIHTFKFKYSKYTKKWCCPHLWYNQGTTGSFLGDKSISNSCSNKHRYTIWLLSSFLTFFFHYFATFFSYFVECNLLKMMHITSKKKKKHKRSRSTTFKLFNLISFSGQD